MNIHHRLRETTEKLLDLMKQEVADEINSSNAERLDSFFKKSQALIKRGEFLTVDCSTLSWSKNFDLLNWVILPRNESKITVCLQKSVFESVELFTLEWRPVIFVYEKSLLLSLDRVSETCKVESGKEGARLEFGKPVEFNIKPFIDQIISQDRLGGVM
jgi:hypothetical protein